MTTPPPRPVSEPRKPAASETRAIAAVNSRLDILRRSFAAYIAVTLMVAVMAHRDADSECDDFRGISENCRLPETSMARPNENITHAETIAGFLPDPTQLGGMKYIKRKSGLT